MKKVKARSMKKVKARSMKKVKAMSNLIGYKVFKGFCAVIHVVGVTWMCCLTFPATPALLFLWAVGAGTIADVYYLRNAGNE